MEQHVVLSGQMHCFAEYAKLVFELLRLFLGYTTYIERVLDTTEECAIE